MLSKATSSNTKQLWSMIKKTDNWGRKHSTPVGSYSANASKIATDVDYCKDKIISHPPQLSCRSCWGRLLGWLHRSHSVQYSEN